MSRHSRERVSSALKSSGGIYTLQCICAACYKASSSWLVHLYVFLWKFYNLMCCTGASFSVRFPSGAIYLSTCGDERNWNTWIKLFGWISWNVWWHTASNCTKPDMCKCIKKKTELWNIKFSKKATSHFRCFQLTLQSNSLPSPTEGFARN